MKKILLCFISIMLISCNNQEDDTFETNEENPSATTFTVLNANTQNEITDMFFLDVNQGVLCGSFGLYSKTNDGGENWTALDVGVNFSFLSTFMLNPNIYFTGRVGLYATTNAGETFQEIGNLSNFSDSIFFIHFFDSNNGILNKGPVMLKTENCGQTWEITFNDAVALNRLQMINNTIGFVSGGTTFDGFSEGIIIKTINGGNTWERLSTDAAQIMAIHFQSITVGYYVDFFGGVFKTTDGGISWDSVSEVQDVPTGIVFLDEEIGYIVTFQGSILETVDGGVTWETVFDEAGASFTNIEKFENAVIAYGNEGLILKLEQ